jgi:hypothetical protein
MAVVVGTGTATEPGVSGSSNSSFAGVRGSNTGKGNGVTGFAKSGNGVSGESDTGPGVNGLGKGGFAGVRGSNSDKGNGVSGFAESGDGVRGESKTGSGVTGFARNGDGVRGESSGGGAGVRGISTNEGRVGVVGENSQGGFAGLFVGDVDVRGSLFCDGDIVLRNADCAEHFDIAGAQEIEPGTVMVINAFGALEQSGICYDKRVAGVVSGAGDYRPALILDKQETSDQRMPIALIGKTFCKVDASDAPIEVGDLLTTSSTPGYAMKAADPHKAFGAVIGKALRPQESGKGLIPILIALQ